MSLTNEIDVVTTTRLLKLHEHLSHRETELLGYPLTKSLDLEQLRSFIGFNINNLGDPFKGGYYDGNTFEMEREVIYWFADLFHLPKEVAWGYVGSCGSEGNLRGLSFGKFKFPNAIFYASKKVHYSVNKSVRLMGGELILVDVNEDDSINCDDLRRKLKLNKPAIVCLTAGTTMAGSSDDVKTVMSILKESIKDYYIHMDAALSGLIFPYTNGPKFDFSEGVDSVSVSGHKMLGTPIPSGIFVCYQSAVDKPEVEYLGSQDTTLSGSRSGLAVLAVWLALQMRQQDMLKAAAEKCLRIAKFCKKQLDRIGWENKRLEYSTTVVIRRPLETLVRKWQLCVQGDESHVVCMPHVSEHMISKFVFDLQNSQPHVRSKS